MSYNLTDNLKFRIEAINLTDQVNDQFVDEANRLNVLTHSRYQFTAGCCSPSDGSAMSRWYVAITEMAAHDAGSTGLEFEVTTPNQNRNCA